MDTCSVPTDMDDLQPHEMLPAMTSYYPSYADGPPPMPEGCADGYPWMYGPGPYPLDGMPPYPMPMPMMPMDYMPGEETGYEMPIGPYPYLIMMPMPPASWAQHQQGSLSQGPEVVDQFPSNVVSISPSPSSRKKSPTDAPAPPAASKPF
eukprot:CAMPEP_0117896712 /NCGR_PEP_ID=MMETSP0950-20121206/27419_1 /TAXON_ID=44440 /ORGANISM="Chattonella subsalsa, Strain CCMP2191" /LENGTH=149 /DNA_ID=CAMNT_0005757883 /DNA_START=155 /DNA_END=604 /DNA_ORIENTATION=-